MRRAVLLALTLVACAAAPTAAQDEAPPDPSIADGSAQRDLDAARAAWKAGGLMSYRWRIARGCFCPEPYTRARNVTVRGGVPSKRTANEVREFATVTRLFRIVQSAIDRKVAVLTVSYDARLGYPRRVWIDVSPMIADEETSYRASRLTRLR